VGENRIGANELSPDDDAQRLAWSAAADLRSALREGDLDAATETMAALTRFALSLRGLSDVSAPTRMRVVEMALGLAQEVEAKSRMTVAKEQANG
jgi:hypothetical protein